MRFLLMTGLLLTTLFATAQHPLAFATTSDITYIRQQLGRSPRLQASFADIRRSVDAWIGKDVDVPFPKDAAGGYTHDRHKENYMIVFNAGLLYQLTGDTRYARLSRDILLKYAALNPTLKKHPQATSSSPGHIFWQALNDANWLVYCGLGYDLIYNSLTPAERSRIETGAFKPEVDYLTGDLATWFDLIHNHGVWACAGVGIVGIATNNPEYLNKALYGTKGDRKSGFIAQLDHLFSPDGYYTEGPYYVRYALLPFYVFANALHHARPDLKIFEHRGAILKKALNAGLQQTNLDGSFLPLNDALKDKDYTTNELVTAIGIARDVYGSDPGWLAVAQSQPRVLLNRGGAQLAAELKTRNGKTLSFPYASVSYTDGAQGNEGGISVLRSGKERELTTLVFKYSAHGLSHGHYDRLNYFLFDGGKEVLSDYGSVRFINVEQKWGGRYLPENSAFAGQTIAHNTVVVDEQSHFNGKEAESEKAPSAPVFIHIGKGPVQAVSAKEEKAYADTRLYRTIYLINLPDRSKPLLVDIFRTESESEHQFDLPYQYSGQLIQAAFPYKAHTKQLETLGAKNGYQFLWKEAEAALRDTLAQFTILNDRTYYSLSTLIEDSARIFFTRSGANDPNFNLRHEPAFVIRKKGRSRNFFSVFEIHGRFDPIAEFSTNAYPSVKKMEWLQQDAEQQVVRILYGNKELIVAQHPGATGTSRVAVDGWNLEWSGPFAVWYEGKRLDTPSSKK